MAISYNSLTTVTTKTRYVVTLTSGTSWTVPAGVTYVNATLQGGGSGGSVGIANSTLPGAYGMAGQSITTTVTGLTPGNTVTYAIGAGGIHDAAGGTTSFTGATSAVGGCAIYSQNQNSGTAASGNQGAGGNNGGAGSITGTYTSGTFGGPGGAGIITLEYWV